MMSMQRCAAFGVLVLLAPLILQAEAVVVEQRQEGVLLDKMKAAGRKLTKAAGIAGNALGFLGQKGDQQEAQMGIGMQLIDKVLGDRKNKPNPKGLEIFENQARDAKKNALKNALTNAIFGKPPTDAEQGMSDLDDWAKNANQDTLVEMFMRTNKPQLEKSTKEIVLAAIKE